MPYDKDVLNVIEILTAGIETNTREEEFYRKSASMTTNESARLLFLAIAQDYKYFRSNLEEKYRGLMNTIRG